MPTPAYPDWCRLIQKQVLENALENVPAYAMWRSRDPGPGASIDDRYRAMPALTKDALRAFTPLGFVPKGRDVQAALKSGEIEYVETSGSTTDAVTNIWHAKWWDASEKASWKLNAHTAAAGLGKHREAILSSPRCVGFLSEDASLPMDKRTLGGYLFLTEKSNPSAWPSEHFDRMILELERFSPTVLEANPSFLSVFCRYAQKRGTPVYQPRIITLTYENPSLIHRRHIASVFRAPAISSYGSTETGYVFMQCEAGRLHQNTEHCRVDFEPLNPGHGGPLIGRILVTTFHNPWRALIRFDVGDLVRLAPSPCPCGRTHGLTLEAIEGRTANATLAQDGRLVTERAIDMALAQVENLDQYELIQTGLKAVSIQYVSEASNGSSLASNIKAVLGAVYGPNIKIVCERVNGISPIAGVKYRRTRADFAIDIGEYLDKTRP